MRWCSVILAAIACLPFGGGSAVAGPNAGDDMLPATRIQDLHYGDVLFNLYLGEDFEALTRLEAYSAWGRLSHHADEASLLAGGLYLQLGMHNEASRRFQALLGPDVPVGVRNKAWFYLARVWYSRADYGKTVEALGKVTGTLQDGLEPERLQLQSNALMYLGRYDEAIRLLEGAKADEQWTAYARFNLGVALARSNRLADADRQLTAVGTVTTRNEELLALKDKANLALGFAYLQADRPAEARAPLERVRLKGPQSNKALLGLGWANASLGQFEQALTPWLELRSRNPLDAAVQEANLAVPYAFGKLGAAGQAADYYEQALQGFADESARIDQSIARIREGTLLREILEDNGTEGARGWQWQLKQVPDVRESRYLYPLLAGNAFQEGLKNIRDLRYLGSTLGRWDESLVVYAEMIGARQRAYVDQTATVDALDVAKLVDGFDARRKQIGARIDDVRPQQRQLEALDKALNEAHGRWLRVLKERESAPANARDLGQRIEGLQTRLAALHASLESAVKAQGDVLADMAVAELEAHKRRMAEYELQARFELASMYDRAAEDK